MRLSCCTWALQGTDVEILDRLLPLGLDAVDIRPSMLRDHAPRAHLVNSGLEVACIAAALEMPMDAALTADGPSEVEAACLHVEDGLDHAASLGVRWAYVVPDLETGAGIDDYFEPLTRLADHAAGLGVGLCIEHFPGTAFATVETTLDALDEIDNPNLFLLFDSGHAQISGEDLAESVQAAGDRIGYVHLNDNDGRGDLHWALTDGHLTEDQLGALFAALDQVGYDGPVSLEMKADLPDPLDAIARSARLVRALLPS